MVLGASAAAAPAADAIEVTSLSDPGDGICGASCTLREAVSTAYTNPGFDTITFKSGLSGTITLDGTSNLELYSPVSIQGPGADQLTVKGGGTRIFYSFDAPATISGLTLTGGNGREFPSSPEHGGAVYVGEPGDLTLDHMVITGNSISGDFRGGGGVNAYNSNLTVLNSTITGNQTSTVGGGISMQGAGNHSLIVRNSTISGNKSGGDGGGIQALQVRNIDVDHSTISGNSATGVGSAGAFEALGTVNAVTIEDSTLSGNTAGSYTGAFYANSAPGGVAIRNSTIAGNSSPNGAAVATATAPIALTSSIVADNTPLDVATSAAASPPMSLAFSLVENPGAAKLTQSPAGSSLLNVDPQLSPLANNGGPTTTRLIAPTSPAVDSGIAAGQSTDQRGLARTSERVGLNAPGSDGTDIGAVELPATSGKTTIEAPPRRTVAGPGFSLAINVFAAEELSIGATGTLTLPRAPNPGHGNGKPVKAKAVALREVTTTAAAGSTVTLTMKPAKKSAARRLAKRLAKGGTAKASITVVLTDARGRSTSVPVTINLKGAKKRT